MPHAIILDANLAILLTVGLTGRHHILRHKRLRQYDETDFRILEEIIASSAGIILCPNVATETSNLIRYIEEPLRGEIAAVFAEVLKRCDERTVPSLRAAQHAAYPRRGLTDAVLMCLLHHEATLVTADLELYLAALTAGFNAINFTHLQAQRPDFS